MELIYLLKVLYFFLPAYIANMAPVLFKFVAMKDTPISEKHFGKNKTWRGLLVATVAGTVVFWIQKMAYTQGFTSLALIDYADFSLLLGFLLGLGAILGDLVKSYYKRHAGIPPGKPWVGWDQIDFVLGALLFIAPLIVLPPVAALLILIVSPLLHIVVNAIGYFIKLRKSIF